MRDPTQTPIADAVRGFFGRPTTPVASKISIQGLAPRLADIRENYRDAATSTETYVRVVAAAHARLTAELAKVDDKRVAAAELKYLPDALLAAELARAERAAVIEACTTTLERLAELPADSALDRATDPLRSLLLALQKVAQSAGGDGAD